MSLARPWWLAGLALLLPLVLLHLRRPSLSVREVSSLALWERLAAPVESSKWRMRRPRHPVLLGLQALALCALVLALAGPARRGAAPAPTTVYVVDGSLWMHVGTRLADARADVRHLAAAEPDAHVALVAASGTPSVAYQGPASGLGGALGVLRAGSGSADLASGIVLGAGLLGDRRGRLIVVRAPEDAIPEIASARGQVSVRVVGRRAPDQGLFARGSRCGIGPAGACEVVATLRNGDSVPRVDRYAAYLDGTFALDLRAAVPAHGTTTVTLTARPGSSVRLQLRGRDALALDDVAWFTVPSAADTPPSMTVTLVGDPATAKPLAQALAAAPGVNLELRTRATYRRSDALRERPRRARRLGPADWASARAGGRADRASPAPGWRRGGPLSAAPVSSTAVGHDLIRGVDLRSLSVDRDAATRLTLPGWLEAVVSSPGGPLLAAGDNGRRRLAVLAFDPPDSNLTQLSAFPILARNLERWAAGWTSAGDHGSLTIDSLPGATHATIIPDGGPARTSVLRGRPLGITGLAPGSYTVAAIGPVVAHRAVLAASLPLQGASSARTDGPIDVTAWARTAVPREESSLSSYLIALVLIAIGGEWIYWRWLRWRP